MKNQSEPVISVVISSYNRADKLHLAIKALTEQSVGTESFEVLVVDNNSTDHSSEVTSSYSDQLDIRFINEPRQGIGYVRDTGFRLAGGEYVAFLDDDAIPDKEYIRIILHNIRDGSPDCICGPIYPYYTTQKPAWFKDQYEIREIYKIKTSFTTGETASGSNMVWKKSVLEVLGGFNIVLGMQPNQIAGGEDTDLYVRYWKNIDNKIVYDPDVLVYHWVPEYKMSVAYILKRNIAAGIAWANMRDKRSDLLNAAYAFRLLVEILVLLVIGPVLFLKHFNIHHWLIEEMDRVAARIGKIAGLLNIPMKLRY